MRIRNYQPGDFGEWLRLRRELWPEITPADEANDATAWLARADAMVMVAARPDGSLGGFVELGARSYADGCQTSPVAFLEGWYVAADLRGKGVGTALIRAAEEWARQRGYRELASDASLENTGAHRAHLALGFSEVERTVRYHKKL